MGNTWFWIKCHSLCAVHPHRRGEHHNRARINARAGGSSPQAWGTLDWVARWLAYPRFIPTGVGNTFPTPKTNPISPVHPHRRGEHAYRFRAVFEGYGSSPQAWGTPDCRPRHSGIYRFIPTGVGNTNHQFIGTSYNAVHPHRRGEHRFMTWPRRTWPGSSPQAWGTHYSWNLIYSDIDGSSPQAWGTPVVRLRQ